MTIATEFRARTGHSAVLWKGKIYIYGGQSFKQNIHTSELWVWDCSLEKMERVNTKNTPVPRNSHGACIDPIKGAMYIFGGANDGGLLGDLHK